MTLGEQLAQVQDAIFKLLQTNIASYKIGEQEIVKNRLRDLRDMERELKAEIRIYGAMHDPATQVEPMGDGKRYIAFGSE